MARIALLDWDNTLHRGWSLDGWAHYLVDSGVLAPELIVEWDKLRQEYLDRPDMTHDELADRANGRYAFDLKGHEQARIVALMERFVTDVDRACLYPFAEPLIARLRFHGVEPVVITGAPPEIVRAHGRRLPLERIEGLLLEVGSDGRYTGEVTVNPGMSEVKAALAARVAADGDAVLAVGDSLSDLPLLTAAPNQLVVGNAELAAQLGPSARLLTDPDTASVDEVLSLVDEILEGTR